MSRKFRPQYADQKGSLIEIPFVGIIEAFGTTVPADTSYGYATGCIFHKTDGGSGTALYINEGTLASSSFKAVDSITALLAANNTFTGNTTFTGTLTPTSSVIRTAQTYQIGRGGQAKAGTTAGWVVNAGNNLGTIATVPQSQTSSTLVIGIPGLHVGDTITGFAVYSSINSAGGAVTLDANLRKLTIAAGATGTDASVGSITQVSVSAATASSASKTGLTEVVTAGVAYYLLLTATTAASTTIELSQAEVTVTTS